MSIVTTNDPAMAPTFAQLGAQSFTETFGHLYTAEDLSSFLATSHSATEYADLLRDPAFCLWLVEDKRGTPVGYAVCGPTDLPIPDGYPHGGELWRLYILQTAQGSGEGKRLLTHCMDWLTARFDDLYLSVYAENFRAQKLYAGFGFKKIHDYHYMVGNHADPEWIMHRKR